MAMHVECLCVNMMHENTYVVYDETKECVVIDCGCYTQVEFDALCAVIKDKGLTLRRLLCTHVHLDHTMGNGFVASHYGISAEACEKDHLLADMMHFQVVAFGLNDNDVNIPIPQYTLSEGTTVSFGNSELTVIETPGHTPGSVSFYSEKEHLLFSGDILMKNGTGATNLPGGKRPKLLASIKEKLFTLPDETIVYAGHGETTTIGNEKKTNPILEEIAAAELKKASKK